MKLLLLFTLTTMAAGFSPDPAVVSTRTSNKMTTTVLRMSSSSSVSQQPPRSSKKDDWSNKPRYQQKSTKPVAVKKVGWLQKQSIPDTMIQPNYFLTWAFALLGPLIIWYHPSYDAGGGPSLIGVAGGLFHMLFATLLWVQTARVRCVFEKDSFEFYNIKGPGLDLDNGAWLEQKPANYVSGTPNRWKYDKIINYGFFPSMEFPVICYFKETETPKEQWSKWFAAFDSYGRGQPHFFPGICNVNEFKEQMELRGVKRKAIPTLKDPA